MVTTNDIYIYDLKLEKECKNNGLKVSVASSADRIIMVPDGLSIHYGGGIGVQANPVYTENSCLNPAMSRDGQIR